MLAKSHSTYVVGFEEDLDWRTMVDRAIDRLPFVLALLVCFNFAHQAEIRDEALGFDFCARKDSAVA